MSHVATQEKAYFFFSTKVPTPSFAKTYSQRALCTCNIFGSRAAQRGGEGRGREREREKKRAHSLSNFMLCSPAKVKV